MPYDYSFPNCPLLEVGHKYIVRRLGEYGYRRIFRGVLYEADERGGDSTKFDFLRANAGYDFLDMDYDEVHFLKYFTYGDTWEVVQELDDSKTGKYDVTKIGG